MKINSAQNLTDEALVFEIVETNSTKLFAILYDRFSKVVYNKCYGFSTNKEEAEDLTHDLFILLFLKLKTFKGNSKFSTWLYAVVNNRCIDHLRKKKNNTETTFSTELEDEIEDITDNDLEEQRLVQLEAALLMLKPNELQLIQERFINKKSLKVIAKESNLTEAGVKMLLLRIKKKLKKEILK